MCNALQQTCSTGVTSLRDFYILTLHLQRQPRMNQHHPTQQALGQQIQLKHQQQPKQLSQRLLIMEIEMIMAVAKNLCHYMLEEEKETCGIFEK